MFGGKYQQVFGKPAIVALGECPSYQGDVLGTLRHLWQLAEMPDVRGLRVFVKPNVIDQIPDHDPNTSPEVVGAILDLLAESGAAEVAVGDGSAFHWDAVALARQTGLLQVATWRGVPWIDLNYDDPQPLPVNDGWLRLETDFLASTAYP